MRCRGNVVCRDNPAGRTMKIDRATNKKEIPLYTTVPALCAFLRREMKPYADTPKDIRRGVEDALAGRPSPGGFVLCAEKDKRLVGALVMLRTGMNGYVPENLLLFIGVERKERCRGLGRSLIDKALSYCSGSVKLHVERDNPARRLYDRIGFTAKYLDMRITLPERRP
jgi:ribosomal-protein-alanine N-acetyltransferase